MAGNKKPRKRRNLIQSVQKSNERILENYCLAQVTSTEMDSAELRLFSIDGKEKRLTDTFQDALSRFHYAWNIHLCVGTYNSKGDKELKEVIVSPPGKQIYRNIVNSVADVYKGIISDLMDKNVRIEFLGWLSRPSGRELTKEEVDKVFCNMGAWETKEEVDKVFCNMGAWDDRA
jgi:hypothetical protein